MRRVVRTHVASLLPSIVTTEPLRVKRTVRFSGKCVEVYAPMQRLRLTTKPDKHGSLNGTIGASNTEATPPGVVRREEPEQAFSFCYGFFESTEIDIDVPYGMPMIDVYEVIALLLQLTGCTPWVLIWKLGIRGVFLDSGHANESPKSYRRSPSPI